MILTPLNKYPRMAHLQGSRRQAGDSLDEGLPWSALGGKALTVAEKLDGANCGISFDTDGHLLLQSRGHYLRGGWREREFASFKAMGQELAPRLWQVLGSRYLLYGEWLWAKHRLFYDQLPGYFIAFDLMELATRVFVARAPMAAILAPLTDCLALAPLLYTGSTPRQPQDLLHLLGQSAVCHASPTVRHEHFSEACLAAGVRPDLEALSTDLTGKMEGLVIKVEDDGKIQGCYKWVCPEFTQLGQENTTDWFSRRLVRNRLGLEIENLARPR
jgi:hypothetical protein